MNTSAEHILHTATNDASSLRERVATTLAGCPVYRHAARYTPDTLANLAERLAPTNRPGPEPVWGLCVETRPFAHLPSLVLETAQRANIPVQVFHGPGNAHLLRNPMLDGLRAAGRLQTVDLGVDELSAPAYNRLFVDPRFWDALAGRGHILVFQTDAALCRGSTRSLDSFLGWDYVGAGWELRRPIGLDVAGGCGGLSLRGWHAHRAAAETWDGPGFPGGEDCFFAFHIELMGGKVAPLDEAAWFATQDRFLHPSFGAHQIDRLPEDERAAFLRYAPEAALARKYPD